MPSFEWESDRAGTAQLIVSADPVFADAEQTIQVRVRQRTSDGRVALNLPERLAMERIAIQNNGLLYWKVLQTNSRDRSVDSSGTFSLSYGVLDQGETDGPARGKGWGVNRTVGRGR